MRGHVVVFGELLLRLTAPGHELLLQTPGLTAQFGGAEANVAVGLATQGHDVRMISTLPDNAIGRACAGELRRHNVGTGGIQFTDGRMGLYFLATGAVTRPSEIIYDRARSAFAEADPAAYDWQSLLAGAEWLHVCGITPAVSPQAETAARAALQAARSLGLKISFDCNYRQKLWTARGGNAPAILRGFIEQCDLLFANERDAALLLGLDTDKLAEDGRFPAAAQALFDASPRLQTIATTVRTHHGVGTQDIYGLVATRHSLHQSRTHSLAGIVDRIGSGDAYAAGLLHGLIQGWDPDRALAFAVAAAALKHSIPGDALTLPEADILAAQDAEGLDVRR
ncbi:MAG: sugar kinase [Azospirillaceae bacterium]|nr:sugar kinase [Azospirillaceae bacterium]